MTGERVETEGGGSGQMRCIVFTEPCVLCTEAMCRLGIYIWGKGKKFYVLTKRVKKKYIFV